MEPLDKEFNIGVSALAWHMYHWLCKFNDGSLDSCLRFAEQMSANYSPREVDEEAKEKLYEAFMRSKQRLDKLFTLHKCAECGSVYTKRECSDCA